jgi:AraC-like DNA-binding protein
VPTSTIQSGHEAGPIQDPALLRRLLRAKDRMDAASHEDWPVQRLARISCVSEAHFARSFKRAFGVPPHRYLLTRRIERAVALLRDTDLTITDVAFQTGWRSLGTFGRIFRGITGASPGQIRSQAKAAARGLERVPGCYLSAAQRPDLTIAVLEKRREVAIGNVRDQDEALAFYVDKLGFRVHTDVRNGDYRWLTVQHPEQPSFQLGLFKPAPPMVDAAIRPETGGR